MKNDPIELQCLTAQVHGIMCIVTNSMESDKEEIQGGYHILTLYRVLQLTCWLSSTCKSIDLSPPDKDLVTRILTTLRHADSLVMLCVLDEQEAMTDRVKTALSEVSNMIDECQKETVRLWGYKK